ncbi:MAG TPA: DNA polymerase IV [Burkholderiaceae bacterium]|nr:DNA polymerase IV [Burkholderiaceae bacterium]
MPPAPHRWIAHLDMDAFYASVELLRYPELAGQPVVIGGGRRHQPQQRADGSREFATLAQYKGRGVITTATYPARDLGVHSGMGLMKAALLAPQAVLLPVDHDEYKRYSRRFKAAVAEVAPCIEDRGIDEIYIDLTDLPGVQDPVGHDRFGGVRALALEIKNNVRRATGLTCSIGLTPNKLLSKIASDLDKPDGLTLITHDDVPSQIWPLPVRRINGVGPKAALKLARLGITRVGELAAREPAFLLEHFGRNYGRWLHEVSHGRDERSVVTLSEPVSMSRETTFDRDLHAKRDRPELTRVFTELVEQVAHDLQRQGYAGRTIGIKLRFDDFKTVTRDVTLAHPVDDAQAIRQAAGQCLKRVDLARRIRLLGVRAGTLVRSRDLPAVAPDGPSDLERELFPGP